MRRIVAGKPATMLAVSIPVPEGTDLATEVDMLHFLATVALLVSAADHWTTYLCLRSPVGGFEVTEANPLAAWLFQSVGLAEGLMIDSVLTVAAVVFLITTPRMPRAAKVACLVAVISWTSFAVANNLEAICLLGLSPLGTT